MVGNIGLLASHLSHLTRNHRPQKAILPGFFEISDFLTILKIFRMHRFSMDFLNFLFCIFFIFLIFFLRIFWILSDYFFFGIFFKVTKVTTKSYQGYYWTPKMA